MPGAVKIAPLTRKAVGKVIGDAVYALKANSLDRVKVSFAPGSAVSENQSKD